MALRFLERLPPRRLHLVRELDRGDGLERTFCMGAAKASSACSLILFVFRVSIPIAFLGGNRLASVPASTSPEPPPDSHRRDQDFRGSEVTISWRQLQTEVGCERCFLQSLPYGSEETSGVSAVNEAVVIGQS